jgi:5-methylcytosine-specific restriction protein B
LVRLCSFHPGYGYEDFLEGYRPIVQDGRLSFELRDGLFKQLCAAAIANPERDLYLIIDEINRADVPRVFGELLTSIERDKRAAPIQLPLSGGALRVPDNLNIIGTMNTADRSISLLDAALRRRFGFIELMPDYGALGAAMVGGLPLAAWLEALNLRLVKVLPRDSRNLQIGHAYLLDGSRPMDSVARLAAALRDDLIPLLQEYCYEDFGALADILTDGLVDGSKQRVRDALFTPEREAELLEVLETMFAELGVVTSAADAEATAGETEELEDVIEGDDASAA